MNFSKATSQYETWLGRRLLLVPNDLAFKHTQMRLAPFPFLRATYYRWAQTWSKICEPASKAVTVLAVGDLHVEHFGTWRDSEGRLIWGINDFDEAWRLPYTNDLIRLTTSAILGGISCPAADAAGTILEGYTDALEAGGRPFVFGEHHSALRAMASARLHEPEPFWAKLKACPAADGAASGAIKAIRRCMPADVPQWRPASRRAGMGSLGRERYVGLVEWGGGLIAREAKALAPSACAWAEQKASAPISSIRKSSAVPCAAPTPS